MQNMVLMTDLIHWFCTSAHELFEVPRVREKAEHAASVHKNNVIPVVVKASGDILTLSLEGFAGVNRVEHYPLQTSQISNQGIHRRVGASIARPNGVVTSSWRNRYIW